MKKSWNERKSDIKDWFIIERIKLTNFIKEHKYISTGIFVFLFAGIVGFIVYASDTEYNAVLINEGATLVNITNDEILKDPETGKPKKNPETGDLIIYTNTFSNFSFNIIYKLNDNIDNPDSCTVVHDRKVRSESTIKNDNIDISWQTETGIIEGNKLILEKTDITSCIQQEFEGVTFKVGNVKPGTEIELESRVYDVTGLEEGEEPDEDKIITDTLKILVVGESQSLKTKTIGGLSFNNFSDTEQSLSDNQKYASFGLMVGVDKETDFKGKYFEDTEIELNPTGENSKLLSVYKYEEDKYKQYLFVDPSTSSSMLNSSTNPNFEFDKENNKLKLKFPSINSIGDSNKDDDIAVINSFFILTSGTGNVTLNGETVNYSSSEVGTPTYHVSILDSNGVEYSNTDTVMYGEEIIFKSEYLLSADATENKNVSVTIPINDAGVEKYKLVSYFENPDDALNEYYINDGYELKEGSYQPKYFEGTTILDSITYSFEARPGEPCDFRIRLELKDRDIENIYLNAMSITYISNINTIKKIDNKSIYVSKFRAGLDLYAENGSNNVNGAETKVKTYILSPSISLPKVNSDYFVPSTMIKTAVVKVELPQGINYVENKNYDKPEVSADNRILYYKVPTDDIKQRMNQIKFDVNFDLSLKEGFHLIKATLYLSSDDKQFNQLTNIIDDSNSYSESSCNLEYSYKTSKELRDKIYSNSSVVSKNSSFDIITEIYNGTNEDKTIDNLFIRVPENINYSDIVLPEVENIMCTTEFISTKEDLEDKDKWFEDCTEDIKGIKISNITIASDSKYSQIITLALDKDLTKAGDKYKFNGMYTISDKEYIIGDYNIEVENKKISGIVWEDFNEDGYLDEDEDKISKVKFDLYNQAGEMIDSTVSDLNGMYEFSDVSNGNYYIIVTYHDDRYAGITNLVTDETDKSKISSFHKIEDLIKFYDKDKEETKREIIEITNEVKSISNINLGLTLNKQYKLKVTKTLNKAYITNSLGFTTEHDLENQVSGKLDVKDISNLKIKVVYNIELENIGSYPGYVYNVIDEIPDGMAFNPNYSENKGWELNSDGFLENKSLANTLLYGKGKDNKKNLMIAFDITQKEAGKFVNKVIVRDEDMQMLAITNATYEEGGNE